MSLEGRDERAAYLRELRKAARERRVMVTRDQFLQEWLADMEQANQDLNRQSYSDKEQAELAERAGFRSVRAWQAARKDLLRLHHDFVHAEPFKKLWHILKKFESLHDYPWAYSNARAGVPSRLLKATIAWHQAPKFTIAERREHSKKIAQACQTLEDLLGQLEPSHSLDEQYSRFRFTDESQAKAVTRVLKSSSDEGKIHGFHVPAQWSASQLMQQCGIIPLWAVRNIKAMALDGRPISNPLPAKVKAKGAKKTFFIRAVIAAIEASTGWIGDPDIKPQLIADIVELMSGMDCTADDVRKARAVEDSEDSGS